MKSKGEAFLEKVFDRDLMEQAVNKALNKACILVENAAKEKCPVDTGELRRSITHEVKGHEGTVGTNLEYAPYVEFGTGLFAEAGDGRTDVPWKYQDEEGNWHSTIGQHPQPFLRPALEENKQQILDIFKQELLTTGGTINVGLETIGSDSAEIY